MGSFEIRLLKGSQVAGVRIRTPAARSEPRGTVKNVGPRPKFKAAERAEFQER